MLRRDVLFCADPPGLPPSRAAFLRSFPHVSRASHSVCSSFCALRGKPDHRGPTTKDASRSIQPFQHPCAIKKSDRIQTNTFRVFTFAFITVAWPGVTGI